MPQGFCILKCIPEPFAFDALNTSTTSGVVDDPVQVVWDDGSIDTWTIEPPTPILPAPSYGGDTFDTTLFAWLLVAVKGKGPYVVKEADQASMDAVLTGTPTRAVLRRIADGMQYPIPQV